MVWYQVKPKEGPGYSGLYEVYMMDATVEEQDSLLQYFRESNGWELCFDEHNKISFSAVTGDQHKIVSYWSDVTLKELRRVTDTNPEIPLEALRAGKKRPRDESEADSTDIRLTKRVRPDGVTWWVNQALPLVLIEHRSQKGYFLKSASPEKPNIIQLAVQYFRNEAPELKINLGSGRVTSKSDSQLVSELLRAYGFESYSYLREVPSW